jgi:rhodanese-related sulfurtransferase
MAVKDITKEELKRMIIDGPEKLEIIDVRDPGEYEIIHLKNSKLIPMGELEKKMDQIDWNKRVVFVCRSGSRSRLMASMVAPAVDKEINNLKYGIIECFQDPEKCGGNLVVDEKNIGFYF